MEMKINVSEGRFADTTASLMKRVVPAPKELEITIDPLAFPMDAEWLQYKPKTHRQKRVKKLFLKAKEKGRLHAFTCMAIDASYDEETGKLIYKKGLPPAVGHSINWWMTMLKNYDPTRNSRLMTKTEYACKCLFLIWKLVEEKNWEVKKAWKAVCDNSKKLGHTYDSKRRKCTFEPTGSREVCGFYDLCNTRKMLADDPWHEVSLYWIASATFLKNGKDYPIAELCSFYILEGDFDSKDELGLLAMDPREAA